MLRSLISSIILLLLFSVGYTQQEEKLEIRNIRGLNTVAGAFSLQPTESKTAHNIDWGRNIGSITKRYGYDTVSSKTGADSNIAIYAAYYSDGTQQLFFVADSASVGYGKIWKVPKGSVNLDSATLVWDYYSVINNPSFTMFNDKVFISNGLQKPLVYVEDSMRSFPVRGIGEPNIIPLMTSGNLDGEYRYGFKAYLYNTDSTVIDTMYPFELTPPINVKNKQVLMKDFWWFANDSLCDVDYATIFIYRTKASQKNFSDGMKLYLVDSIFHNDSATLVAATFTDNVADASLGSAITFSPNEFYGRDSSATTVLSRRYYNSPGFLRSDTTAAGNDLFDGYYTGAADTTGFSYIVTIVDTITGVESNASAPFVYHVSEDDTASHVDTIVINLPPVPPDLSGNGYFYNIYRAPLTRIQTDSTYFIEYWEELNDHECVYSNSFQEMDECENDPDCDVIINKSGGWFLCRGGVDDSTLTKKWESAVIKDSKEFGNYIRLTTISTDSASYIDTIQQSAITINHLVNPFYEGQSSPVLLENIFSFQGRLWGSYKSALYWSDIDNIYSWGAMNRVDISPSDGDVITSIWAERQAIRVFKNNSSYNVYAGDDNISFMDWNKTEITGYYGCIAPRSHAAGVGGHYYLSDVGVLKESEGGSLERTYAVELVSKNLNNFDKLSHNSKVNAVGFYFDRKYMLSIGDTTYVYDERTGDWATWDLVFNDAVKFNPNEDNQLFVSPDSMYFITGDKFLYQYATSEEDNGVVNNILWKSAPLLISEKLKRVTSLGLWSNTTSSDDSVVVNISDQNGTSYGNTSFVIANNRYNEKAVSINALNYLTLSISTVVTDTSSTIANIDGIDIYYIVTGRKGDK